MDVNNKLEQKKYNFPGFFFFLSYSNVYGSKEQHSVKKLYGNLCWDISIPKKEESDIFTHARKLFFSIFYRLPIQHGNIKKKLIWIFFPPYIHWIEQKEGIFFKSNFLDCIFIVNFQQLNSNNSVQCGWGIFFVSLRTWLWGFWHGWICRMYIWIC